MSQNATMWQNRVLLCKGCGELADKQKARLDAMAASAHQRAVQELEQRILRGGLIAPEPGVGA